MDIPVQEDLVFVADIVFDRPLRKSFSYLIPTELFNSVSKGKRVKVPLGKGNKPTIGFCVDTRHISSDPKLKSIFAIMDEEPLVSAHLLEFTKWIADYYLCGWGQVLQAVVPAWVRSGANTPKFSSWILAINSACPQQLKIQPSTNPHLRTTQLAPPNFHQRTLHKIGVRANRGEPPCRNRLAGKNCNR